VGRAHPGAVDATAPREPQKNPPGASGELRGEAGLPSSFGPEKPFSQLGADPWCPRAGPSPGEDGRAGAGRDVSLTHLVQVWLPRGHRSKWGRVQGLAAGCRALPGLHPGDCTRAGSWRGSQPPTSPAREPGKVLQPPGTGVPPCSPRSVAHGVHPTPTTPVPVPPFTLEQRVLPAAGTPSASPQHPSVSSPPRTGSLLRRGPSPGPRGADQSNNPNRGAASTPPTTQENPGAERRGAQRWRRATFIVPGTLHIPQGTRPLLPHLPRTLGTGGEKASYKLPTVSSSSSVFWPGMGP